MVESTTTSLNELIYIFYSGYSGSIEYDKLNNLILALNEAAINLTKILEPNTSKYNEYLDKIYGKEIKTIDLSGARQDNGHFALKLIASDYLKSLNKKYKYELKLQDRLADVIADDFSIIIECGNTDPGKIFDYLEESLVKKIFILPYPDETDNGKLFFYKFERGKYFKKYLEAMNEIKFSKIKQLILNRKK